MSEVSTRVSGHCLQQALTPSWLDHRRPITRQTSGWGAATENLVENWRHLPSRLVNCTVLPARRSECIPPLWCLTRGFLRTGRNTR